MLCCRKRMTWVSTDHKCMLTRLSEPKVCRVHVNPLHVLNLIIYLLINAVLLYDSLQASRPGVIASTFQCRWCLSVRSFHNTCRTFGKTYTPDKPVMQRPRCMSSQSICCTFAGLYICTTVLYMYSPAHVRHTTTSCKGTVIQTL
jgi:hypothetical protein